MSGLRRIIDPLENDDFFEKYWGKKAVYIPGSDDKFENACDWDDINYMLQYRRFAPGQIRLIHQKNNLPPSELQNLPQWLTRGATLTFNFLQQSHDRVADISKALASDLNTHVNTNCYTSYPTKQGFDTHFDGHDVFILQTAGEKEWFVYEPTVNWPMDLQAKNRPPFDEEERKPYVECVMTPGDVLYIPRGHWHYAIAITPSIHLTVGPESRTGIDFLTWLQNNWHLEEDWLRKNFPVACAAEFGGDRPEGEIQKHLEEFGKHVASMVTDPNLYQQFLHFTMSKSDRSRKFQLPYIALLEEGITPDTAFTLIPDEKPLIYYDEEKGCGGAWLKGATVTAQDVPRVFLETIFEKPGPIHGNEILEVCPELKWEQIRAFLMNLYTRGLVLLENPELSLPPRIYDKNNKDNNEQAARNDLADSQSSEAQSGDIPLNQEWKDWIQYNMGRGCDLDGIFKILIDNGFNYDAIKKELDYEPSKALDKIENPLTNGSSGNIDDQPAAAAPVVSLANARKLPTDQANIFVVEDFLNEVECKKLIKLIEPNLVPSTVVSPKADPEFRTSSTCFLSNLDNEFVQETEMRICNYLGINPSYLEGLQGQRYKVGEQFKPHTDTFNETDLKNNDIDMARGQRTFSCMIYLNDVEKGGGTKFNNLDYTEEPKQGKLILWNNIGNNGEQNQFTMHQGLPVEQGEKVVVTAWFREKGEGEMFAREDNENLPAYTTRGFDREKIPTTLYRDIRKFYRENRDALERETVDVISSDECEQASRLLELPANLKERIHNELQPEMEEWCGIKLEPTYIYGVREYARGAELDVHRDRLETHIISALLNIDQEVEEDWPLHIDDHFYRRHELNIAPGEMLFYEGGKLAHGRPEPLKGERFSNVFVHYRPVYN